MKEQQELTTKEAKQALKAKFKSKLEALERSYADSLRGKLLETELTLKEQHRLEIDAIADQYALNYIEIREHEVIVQRELDLKHDANLRFINELKEDHETNLNLLKDDFNAEQEKLRAIVLNLENKLEHMSNDFSKAIEIKERAIRDLTQQRTLHEVEETRILIQKEASLRSQLNEREQEVAMLDEQLEQAALREHRMSEEVTAIK